jgi:transmembrane sensor
MSRLPTPVRRVLRSEADELALERMWRGIQRRRAERARGSPRLRWLVMVAAAAAVLVAIVTWRRAGVGTGADAGPLHLAGGSEISALVAPDAPVTFTLSDGSQIELALGARVEALENGPTSFDALVSRGRATFDVRPGGPRRWSIEAGLATVEVVGTRFTVERLPAGARVAVERGVVVVRGERVRDHVQRLAAGESLEVDDHEPIAPPPTAPVESAAAPVSAPAKAPPSPSAAPATPTAPAPSAAWRRLAQEGDNAQAYATLGPAGIASASHDASVDDLLALADVARRSGHPADAVAPLSQVVSSHGEDPRAPLAAFTLGRLQLDALSQPALAAQSFSRAISLGLPTSLQEDAFARLVEARARAGDGAGAKAAARDYEQRFPAGQRLEQVRRWARAE